MVSIPCRDLSVRFEAAMRDYRNAVMAFVDDICRLKTFVGVAAGLLRRGFRVVTGLCWVSIAHKVGLLLIVNTDRAGSVARLLFGFRRERENFLAGPEDVLARLEHDLYGLHTGHSFRGGSVNGLDSGLGIG